MTDENLDFCTICRKNTHYHKEKRIFAYQKIDRFCGVPIKLTTCICDECNHEMSPHGMIDLNVKEYTEQIAFAKETAHIDDGVAVYE